MTRIHGIEVELKRFRVTTTIALDRRILEEACVALEQAASSRPNVIASPWYENGPSRVVRIAAGLAVAAAVVLVAVVLWSPSGDEHTRTVESPKPTDRPGHSPVPGREDRLAAEREQINIYYASVDVDALVRMLGSALPENRILIAFYLGKIGDARAIEALSQEADQWEGDPTDNPFTRAIKQIGERTRPQGANDPNDQAQSPTLILLGSGAVPVLSGTITDAETGRGIFAATVRIRRSDGGRLYTATTNRDGVYAFEDVKTDGRYDIWLSAFAYVTPDRWEEPRQTVELSRGQGLVKNFVLEKGATINIRTVDERDEPVSGVHLHVAYAEDEIGRGPEEPLESGAGGTMHFCGLRPEEYVVVAAHPGYARAAQAVRIEQPQQVKSVTLRLERGVNVAGLATCSDGLSPSGWLISAEPTWWHNACYWPFHIPIADDGSFTLRHIVPGTYHLSIGAVVKGSPLELWSADVDLPPEGDLLDLQIAHPSSYAPNPLMSGEGVDGGIPHLQRVAIAGRVVDGQTNQPVTDFQTHIVGQGHWTRVRNPEGLFELEGNASAPVRVHVQAEGYGGNVSDDIDPKAGEPVMIVLGKSGSLSGICVDVAGQPVQGVDVSHRFGLDTLATTDTSGRFTIPDIPATGLLAWFAFRHPDYAHTVKAIEAVDEAQTDVTVVMREGGTIEGRLYDGQGRPRPYASVYFLDEDQYCRGTYDTMLKIATADGDGFYYMDRLPRGLWYIVTDKTDDPLGIACTCAVLEDGQTLWFDIGGSSKATGRILRGGTPLANTLVMVTDVLDSTTTFEAYARTDALGRFTFHGMPDGQRGVYWGASEPFGTAQGWCRLSTVDFRDGVNQELGEFDVSAGEVVVELVAESPRVPLDSWDLVVVGGDKDVAGVPRKRIGRLAPRGDGPFRFGLSGLPTGAYEIVAQKEGYPSIRHGFMVNSNRANQALGLSIPFGSAILSGVLTPFISVPVRPILVLKDSGEDRVTADIQPASDGSFLLENLPTARYEIIRVDATRTSMFIDMRSREYRHIRLPVVVDLTDEKGYLAVLVVTETGVPLRDATVRIVTGGGTARQVSSLDAGVRSSFVVRPGVCRLSIDYPGFRSASRTVEVKAMRGRTMQEVLEPVVITMRRD